MRTLFGFMVWLIVLGILALPNVSKANEYVVYGSYRALDMGNPGEPQPPKDYFINAGSSNGLSIGSTVNVYRRTATYDLLSEKLYKEIMFPIAKLKIIHVESNVAVARLDKMNTPEKTPAMTPFAVMIGDLVRPGQ